MLPGHRAKTRDADGLESHLNVPNLFEACAPNQHVPRGHLFSEVLPKQIKRPVLVDKPYVSVRINNGKKSGIIGVPVVGTALDLCISF